MILAAALVLVVAVLATITLTRKAPAMTHRITHPDHVDETSSLPPSYDDPSSLSWVPDALRPFWPDGELDRLEERDAVARHERRARVDVVRLTDPRRFYAACREAGIDPDSRPLSDVESALWGGQAVSLPPLDAAGAARALHLERLERAARAARSSQQEENAAAMREAYRCRACRGPKPTISAPLCPPCESVAAAVRLELVAAQLLEDGRSRSDAVRTYLRS